MGTGHLIRIADRAYPDGKIAEYYGSIMNDKSTNKMKLGDSLAEFVVKEIISLRDASLSDRSNRRNVAHAIENAIIELEAVRAAFEKS